MQVDQEEQDYIDLQQYWLILKRRWLPAVLVTGSVIGLAAFVTFRQKQVYQAEGKLLFNKSNNISSLSGLGGQIGELSGITNLSNPLDTEAEVIQSHPLIRETITKFDLKNKEGEPLPYEAFLKQLSVKTIRGTDVLQLSYKSTDPKEAANVINSLMNDYLKNNVENNTSEVRAAREFLQKELPEIEARVVQAEAALRQFKEQNGVVALEEEARVGVESLNSLSQNITQAQAQLVEAMTRSEALKNQLKLQTQQAVALSSLSQSPAVQQVLTEFQKTQDELAVARTRLTDEHPTIINLSQKLQALRNQLEGRVGQIVGNGVSVREPDLQIGELKQALTAELVKSEVDRLAAINRVGLLSKALTSNQARLGVLPKLEQQQRELQRKLQAAQSTYEQLLKQFQEAQVVEKQNVGNARVIASALVPDVAISPKILLNLALGGFLGILLGVGTALILEAMDKSLKTLDEAKRLLGYPLLGTIPHVDEKDKEKKELPVLNNPYSPATNAFEILQTNLGFTISDKALKVIVVSSSITGEGKSFVSANLAVAIAQVGRRVLLIDADMRRPRQQEIWNLPNMIGLSNVLVGQATLHGSVAEALVTLDVLTCGKIPPNPLALLESQRMASLVKDASLDYDFVIIDAPPLTAVADALNLGKLADGMLLVVRPGVANTGSVSAAKSLLQQSGQRVLGMVVNGVTGDNSYGGYYYNKGYYGINPIEMNGKVDTDIIKVEIR
ncbi:GumC family protein [Rivularia sp. UHCC 0363]|uniref:GumC family protein n=1 Tax=Rivularia sp. UHCC 0363 TaxID=3110244 RepID=UPI002B1EC263|nr:polysaccharide biosynthesis tyrosine autokinase [Rivularia sp. UHCC 0363]MEA5594471.1 polysaccharide biosynthesis tyrosine autokinase [Rivularia sp. UHCC 0363]